MIWLELLTDGFGVEVGSGVGCDIGGSVGGGMVGTGSRLFVGGTVVAEGPHALAKVMMMVLMSALNI